jgi:hypothetical protein
MHQVMLRYKEGGRTVARSVRFSFEGNDPHAFQDAVKGAFRKAEQIFAAFCK